MSKDSAKYVRQIARRNKVKRDRFERTIFDSDAVASASLQLRRSIPQFAGRRV